MANSQFVKDYIAQWLQLGKQVMVGSAAVAPVPVRLADGYTPEFEHLWRWLASAAIAPQAYLAGTDQTIAQLLSDRWEIVPCARCYTLIPTPLFAIGSCPPCPCHDLPHLPNLDLVIPHPPVSAQVQLAEVADRLRSQSATGV